MDGERGTISNSIRTCENSSGLFQYLLAQIQVTELDWFRIALDREEWKKVVPTDISGHEK